MTYSSKDKQEFVSGICLFEGFMCMVLPIGIKNHKLIYCTSET